ncbi:MAG: hypothetical protein WCR24_07325 [Candidatus Methanomethylophilaceae archaeon]
MTEYLTFLLEYLPIILGVFTLAYALYNAWQRNVLRMAVCFVVCIFTFVLGV